jgi:small subunit ribosomal protein S8
MGMIDPIADMLTRIRNATSARHDKVDVPWSRIKEQMARVLAAEGFAREVVVSGAGAQRKVTVLLRYSDAGESVISGIRRVSRPGLRVYRPAKRATVVRAGLGISILSTPQGLLVDRDARRRNLGGEVLCEVW